MSSRVTEVSQTIRKRKVHVRGLSCGVMHGVKRERGRGKQVGGLCREPYIESVIYNDGKGHGTCLGLIYIGPICTQGGPVKLRTDHGSLDVTVMMPQCTRYCF